jgi:hypothetical protein
MISFQNRNRGYSLTSMPAVLNITDWGIQNEWYLLEKVCDCD